MKLTEFLHRSVSQFPDRIAVIDQDQSVNYRELADRVQALAAALRRLDLPSLSRVGILIDNSVDYVVAYFAALEVDLVVVPLDSSATAETLRFILDNCGIRVLFAQSRFRRQLAGALAGESPVALVIVDSSLKLPNVTLPLLPIREFVEGAELPPIPKFEAETPALVRNRGGSEHRLAAIFYTSGSTGTPKGVMLSHLNLMSNTTATIEYLKLTEIDRILVILPFYYIYGNSLLLTHIACGGCLVIDNRFLYPEIVLNTLEEQSCTGFSGVPSNFMILLGKSTLTSRPLQSLRYFTQAGGAMAPEITRQLMSAFPRKEIYIMYGQTEASPRVTYVPPSRLTEKLGSIGIPLSGITVTVANEQGRELATGETGELVVTGDCVMMGYWNQPDEERQVLRAERLHTGDLGYKDADGFIFIVGRQKEIIKSGGNRVSVKEVEECLLAHEKVFEACVFGVPDPLLGEAIKAVVVAKPDVSLDLRELQLHCRKSLADYKVPKLIEFAEALPKYQSGKVNRQLLKQQST